ncbi:hypothetical protein DFH07DRAFT_943597 [Mycena maculata]|uniref:F-box domain-containing protein n=1 Tax=Mycena maculata TaxID=230809 RepID=A0AAD7IED3_9AGAR|nr:hypothetical protein DFH07DRAFT_943597 [Mycena maculata]
MRRRRRRSLGGVQKADLMDHVIWHAFSRASTVTTAQRSVPSGLDLTNIQWGILPEQLNPTFAVLKFQMSADLSDAKSARAAARTRITELDVEIEALQRLLEARLFERDKCQEELATYIYPVLTLAVRDYVGNIHPLHPSVSRTVPPARICRAWRTVALSTPTLWSAIELMLDNADSFEHLVQLLETWLTRSGGCPLSIALLCDYDVEISTTALVEAIVRHASRWQEIELLLPYDDLPQLTGVMPLLRTLTLGAETLRTASAPVADPVVIFTEAPNLKEVVLSEYFNPFCITLPWSQITKLTATLYDREAAAILRDAAALEECCLTLFYKLTSPIPPIPPLPRLRSLVLSALDTWRVAGTILLPALTLPALEAIKVFEPFLGSDPVATLSALRPHGYPPRIKIFGAGSTSDVITPHEMYAAAFPEAIVNVEL